MNLLPHTSVGFDLSRTSLRVGVVRSFLNRRQLLNTFEIPGFQTLSAEEQVKKLIALRKKHAFPRANFHLVLPHDVGVIRQIELPVEVRDRIDEVVRLQLDTFSPWPVEDVYWGQSSEAPPKGAATFTVTVTVIPKASIEPLIDVFRSSGLPLSGVSPSAVAWAHGTSMLWGDAGPAIILDCEDGYVEGALVYGSKLFVSSVSGSDTQLDARTVVERLVALGRVSDPEKARLIAHGASVESLPEDSSGSLPLENADAKAMKRFGAVTAAMLGSGSSAFRLNVLPHGLRYQQSQLRIVPTYALILLLVGLGTVLLVREPYQHMRYADRIDAEIQRISVQAEAIPEQEAALRVLDDEYRVLASHIGNPDRSLEALHALATVMPNTAWLTNFSYQGDQVTFSGFGEDTAELQRLFEDTALFGGVQFTAPVTTDSNIGKDRFTIRADIEATP